MNCGRHRSHRR